MSEEKNTFQGGDETSLTASGTRGLDVLISAPAEPTQQPIAPTMQSSTGTPPADFDD